MDIINSGQKKLLRKLAVCPSYSFKAIISVAVCFGVTIFGSMSISMKYSSAMSPSLTTFMIAIATVMMGVFAYNLVFARSRRALSNLEDVRELALASASDEMVCENLKNGDAKTLCDYFRIDYSHNKSTLIMVLSIVLCMGSYFGAFYMASSDFAKVMASVNEVHQAIEDNFQDVLVLKYRDNPEENTRSYGYNICLEDKENSDIGDIYLQCTTDGKINSIAFNYNLDENKSGEENIKDAEAWIARITDKLPGLTEYYTQPAFSEFKYTMSDELRNDIQKDSKEDYSTNFSGNKVRVYEYYRMSYSQELSVWVYDKNY